MAYRVEFSRAFNEDVRSALDYVKDNLSSPCAAARLMENADDAIALISEMPQIKAPSSNRNLAARDIRLYFVANFAIAYAIKEDAVVFVRFFHQSQLYESGDYWFDSV